MSLDFSLSEVKETEVFSANITHNLGNMASAAGVYEALWMPEKHGFKIAKDIIPALEKGIAKMKKYPAKFKSYDAPNGWGTYDNFLPWLEKVLEACRNNPNAKIYSWV